MLTPPYCNSPHPRLTFRRCDSLGDSISEGTVVQWCKSVGDEVQEDEVIAVVETDKVSVEVRSTHVGVVVKLFAAVDDVVRDTKILTQYRRSRPGRRWCWCARAT